MEQKKIPDSIKVNSLNLKDIYKCISPLETTIIYQSYITDCFWFILKNYIFCIYSKVSPFNTLNK